MPEIEAPPPPPAPGSDEQPLVIVNTDAPPLHRSSADPSLLTVRLLALGVAVLALLELFPVILAAHESWHQQASSWLGGSVLAPWAFAAILVSILHLVYMVYLLQLPDYSCARVVSLFLLLISTGHALILGVRTLAPAGNRMMAALALESNRFSSQQESLWCFLMMTLTGVLSYAAGRAASRWRARLLGQS